MFISQSILQIIITSFRISQNIDTQVAAVMGMHAKPSPVQDTSCLTNVHKPSFTHAADTGGEYRALVFSEMRNCDGERRRWNNMR